jgi:FMN phosphatase YigB (HAD superfamily)
MARGEVVTNSRYRGEGAVDPLLPALCRVAVERLRDRELTRRGRSPGSALSRVSARECLDVLVAQRNLDPAGVGVPRPLAAGLRRAAGLPAPMEANEGVPFARLREEVLKRAEGYAVVGFDLFNTLLLRTVDGEWLKTAVAYGLHERLRKLLSPARLPSVAEVRRRRLELEMEIAGERVARGDDNEVDFEELMIRWAGAWIPRDPYRRQLAGEVRKLELSLERKALRASPGARELLLELRQRGKRVIFVSDMYLSAPVLGELLDHCGLGGLFDAGYASIGHGRRKATGRLFSTVLELEKLQPGNLLFVGDDANSDVRQPGLLGIQSVQVVDPPELRRRHRLAVAQRAVEHNPFWSAHYVQELIRTSGEVPSAPGTSWQVGWQLAPALVAFVIDVAEHCERLGIERVFFLAREGLLFLKIAHILGREGGAETRTDNRYLFLSRASTILASMAELSWEEIHRFWRQYDRQSLNDLLRNLSLPAEEFLPLAAECGITDPNRRIEDPASNVAFQRWLSSRPVRAAFLRHRDAARGMLRRYLEYRGLMGQERVALVDIGWKGSMQDNLVRAFAHDPAFPEVHGFYLGYVDDGRPHMPRSFKYGFLADTRRGDLGENELFRNTAIFEMLTQAHHGSTLRYAPNPWAPHIPVPVLKHHDLEKENTSRFFRAAQQAVAAYTEQFARVRPLAPFRAQELKPGVHAQVMRYVCYPTREEADEFLSYSHVESFGVHEITRFGFNVDVRAVLTKGTPRRMLGELRRTFERNLWKEGVVRRSGVPLANFAYDLLKVLEQTR